jgi:hypothetical protein
VDSNNQDGTLAVTVTQIATVPLSPVVEAVIAALPKATDQQVETYVEENFQRLLDCSFDINDHSDDINNIVERYLIDGSNLDDVVSSVIENYYTILDRDDVGDIVVSVIQEDYSFLTEDDVTVLINTSLSQTDDRIERLEARIEQLEYALRKMGEVLSGLGGNQ